MEFDDISDLVFKEYEKNGYLELWNSPYIEDWYLHRKKQIIYDIAELGLINTEVSEGLEDIRKGDTDHLCEELADIIIRVMNFATRKGIDLESAILEKHNKNMQREKLHGKIV